MILPLHEVRDQNKLNSIAASMEENGWVGLPIVVIDRGDHYQAINGSHRIAAAQIAGIDVEYIEIEEPCYEGDDEVSELFCKLVDGDDIDRLNAIRALNDKGMVDDEAVKIMEAE